MSNTNESVKIVPQIAGEMAHTALGILRAAGHTENSFESRALLARAFAMAVEALGCDLPARVEAGLAERRAERALSR